MRAHVPSPLPLVVVVVIASHVADRSDPALSGPIGGSLNGPLILWTFHTDQQDLIAHLRKDKGQVDLSNEKKKMAS